MGWAVSFVPAQGVTTNSHRKLDDDSVLLKIVRTPRTERETQPTLCQMARFQKPTSPEHVRSVTTYSVLMRDIDIKDFGIGIEIDASVGGSTIVFDLEQTQEVRTTTQIGSGSEEELASSNVRGTDKLTGGHPRFRCRGSWQDVILTASGGGLLYSDP